MTYYVVEHSSSDFRLHRDDGTETGDSWTSRPDEVTVITRIGVDRGLSQSDAQVFAQLIVTGYSFLRSEDTTW